MRMPSSANTAPLIGISAANSHQISCARSTTSASPVNACGSTLVEREQRRRRTRRRPRPTTGSRAPPPRAPARRRRRRAGGRPAPARRSPARRAQREEHEQLERDLVRGQRRRADAREHRRGDEERAEQRGRAHGDLAADPHQRLHAARARGGSKPGAPLDLPRTRGPSRPARSPSPTPSRRGPSRSRRRTAARARR